MGRTNKSVFCAKCKKKLATAVQQGVACGYAFPHQGQVAKVFDGETIAAVEGYLYGLIVCVDLDYSTRNGQTKGQFEKYVERVAMGERMLQGEELSTFALSLLDNTKMVLTGHLVDHPECLVERYLDLSLYYLQRVEFKGLGVIPIPVEAPVERKEHGVDEIDAICDAIEAVLEKA